MQLGCGIVGSFTDWFKGNFSSKNWRKAENLNPVSRANTLNSHIAMPCTFADIFEWKNPTRRKHHQQQPQLSWKHLHGTQKSPYNIYCYYHWWRSTGKQHPHSPPVLRCPNFSLPSSNPKVEHTQQQHWLTSCNWRYWRETEIGVLLVLCSPPPAGWGFSTLPFLLAIIQQKGILPSILSAKLWPNRMRIKFSQETDTAKFLRDSVETTRVNRDSSPDVKPLKMKHFSWETSCSTNAWHRNTTQRLWAPTSR